jgi:hypothetical protein
MTEFNFLADIGRRDFIKSTLEADGGIIIGDALVTDEEDLIEFGFGEPADFDSGNGGIIAIDGSIVDAGMVFMVVVILEPDPKGLIEVIEGDTVLDPGEEAIPDGPEKAFHFSAGRAVIGFGVDEGDTGQGAAFG